MSAAQKKKKKSANDLIDELLEKQFQLDKHIDAISKEINNIKFPTANTSTNIFNNPSLFDDFYVNNKHRFDGMFRQMTKKTVIKTSKPDSKDTTPPLKIVDETVVLPMENFTNLTHSVHVYMNKQRGSYDEKISTKLVGKKTVEWWEYFMIYGFTKRIKTEIALEKNRSMISKPRNTIEPKNKIGFGIVFHPKSNGKQEKILTNFEGENIYKLKGTKYVQDQFIIDVPYIQKLETIEYLENGLIFEEKIDTFEPDYTSLLNSLEYELKLKKINDVLRLEIAKQIYGRLRGI